LIAKCGGDVGLPVPGRADQADGGGLLDPRELGEMGDERAFGAGICGEVEVLQGLRGGEAGGADALAGAGGLAREHFGVAERLQELLVGPALRAGALGGRLQAVQDPRRLEGAQQVGQPLAGRGGHALSSA
jgi:hypothetical protein